MSRLLAYYTIFGAGMGVYGATRGYRSRPYWDQTNYNNTLMGRQLMNSVTNGIWYSLPMLNLIHFCRLINRIDLHYQGYDISEYKHEFKELDGYCKDII